MNYFATINLNLLLGCTFFLLTLTTPSVQFNEISLEETQQQKNTNAKSLNLSRLEKDVVFIGNSKHFRIRTDTGVSLDDAQRTTVSLLFISHFIYFTLLLPLYLKLTTVL